MKLEYHNSKPSTVGIELELRLLDPNTYAVKNCAQDVFDNIDSAIKSHVHKELLKSMIEIVTPVCHTIDEAVKFVSDTANKVSQIGKKHDFICAALPMHPFEIKEDNEIENENELSAGKIIIVPVNIATPVPTETPTLSTEGLTTPTSSG